MPGYRAYRKRRGAPRRKYVRRPMKKQSSVVSQLVRKVNGLIKDKLRKDDTVNLAQYNNNSITSQGYGVLLSNFAGMQKVFGTDGDDTEDNKIIHSSVGMDIEITLENTLNNEESTTRFTTFLVSLKDNIGSAFNPSSGALSLTPDIHYYQQAGGQCLLNKKCFNIHKIKRFTLTNYDTALTASAAQSQYGTVQRWYWKLPIGKVIQNPTGSWDQLGTGLDPSKTYYILVFNDNSTLDLENPVFRMSAIHTMKKCM